MPSNCQLKLGKVPLVNRIDAISDVRVLTKMSPGNRVDICLVGFVDTLYREPLLKGSGSGSPRKLLLLNLGVKCGAFSALIFTARAMLAIARNARIASAVLATPIPCVCLSVRPSVCHTPVLCQNDGT